MSSVIVKREVVMRSIVTENLRNQLMAELDTANQEVQARIEQLDFQTRSYITDLQRTNLQQAMVVKKQVEAEKKRHEDLKDALAERRAQVLELVDGAEIVRGTMESWVEVKVGDNLRELLGGVEIVTKDDEIIDIRQRSADEQVEDDTVQRLISEVRNADA